MSKQHNYLVNVLLLLVAGNTAAALASTTTTFIVGDDQGWTINVDYISWVKGKTFAIGDKLVFNYASAEHTVTEVGKADYFACAGGDALSSDRSGSTNVTLTVPGTRYFICSIPGHCTIGMSLAVTVAAGAEAGGEEPPGATPTTGGDAAAGATVRPAMMGSFLVEGIAWAMIIKLALS